MTTGRPTPQLMVRRPVSDAVPARLTDIRQNRPPPSEPADRSMDRLEHVVAVLVLVAAFALRLMQH